MFEENLDEYPKMSGYIFPDPQPNMSCNLSFHTQPISATSSCLRWRSCVVAASTPHSPSRSLRSSSTSSTCSSSTSLSTRRTPPTARGRGRRASIAGWVVWRRGLRSRDWRLLQRHIWLRSSRWVWLYHQRQLLVCHSIYIVTQWLPCSLCRIHILFAGKGRAK